MKTFIYAAVLGSVLVSACMTAPGPGMKEGAVPPKLVIKDNAKTWDNTGSFGPVPASLTAKGEQSCATLNTMDAKFMAIGYHSHAMNADGKVFAEGGYYCARK